MYELMATVRSLDVANLATISTYKTMSITRDDIPNQSNQSELLQPGSWQLFLQVGYSYRCKLFTKAAKQQTKIQKIYFYSSSGQLKKFLELQNKEKRICSHGLLFVDAKQQKFNLFFCAFVSFVT